MGDLIDMNRPSTRADSAAELAIEDTVAARLTQASAVLEILQLAISGDGEANPNSALVGDAVWAARELLEQASAAHAEIRELRKNLK